MTTVIKTVFFSSLMSLTIVRFDTQDNIYKNAFSNEWSHQESDPAIGYIPEYTLKRELIKGKPGIRLKTLAPVKMVRLNDYPFKYKVKRVSDNEYEITSTRLQDYFDETDIIEVVIKSR